MDVHLAGNTSVPHGEVVSVTVSSQSVAVNRTTLAINQFDRYYMWIILILGFPGNTACIITITRMCALKSSTFYVVTLACIDNIAIILKSVYMELKHNPYTFSPSSCKVISFCGLLTSAFANWILLAMAAERLLAVQMPLKVSRMWTLKRAVILALVIFLVLFCLHFHLFWTVTSMEYGCGHTPEYTYFTDVTWYWISASVYAFIPCSCLMVINCLIVLRIRRSSLMRRRLTLEKINLQSRNRRKSSSCATDNHITVMLVSVTIVFVIVTIPRCIIMIILTGPQPNTPDEKARLYLADVLTSFFADSNHAVNFYLYFVAAKQFRHHFINLVTSITAPGSYRESRRQSLSKMTSASPVPLSQQSSKNVESIT